MTAILDVVGRQKIAVKRTPRAQTRNTEASSFSSLPNTPVTSSDAAAIAPNTSWPSALANSVPSASLPVPQMRLWTPEDNNSFRNVFQSHNKLHSKESGYPPEFWGFSN